MSDYLIKKSICLFCSLGCGVCFRTDGNNITALDYDKENPVNCGALCPRGHYNLELISHPRRLTEPRIGRRKVSWEEALVFTKQELREFAKDKIGLLLAATSSNEDALSAARFANQLGTQNIAASGNQSDLAAYAGSKWSVAGANLATLSDIENAAALVIVGDILTRSPVLAKRINQVKYGKRGNRIIVIDPHRSHTSWFATDHLLNRPGTEALVVAALTGKINDLQAVADKCGIAVDKISAAAAAFAAAPAGAVIVVPGKNKERNDLLVYFAKELAAASANKKFIVYYNYGNTLGVNAILDREVPDHSTFAAMIAKIERQELEALFMLGENICTEKNDLAKKMRLLKFVAVSGYFGRESSITSDTAVTFPLASHLERAGSFLLADGRTERVVPVGLPIGTKSNAEIIAALANMEISEPQVELVKGEAARFDQLAAEVLKLEPRAEAPLDNITHFGNNRLVSNFFWYRVNNKNG